MLLILPFLSQKEKQHLKLSSIYKSFDKHNRQQNWSGCFSGVKACLPNNITQVGYELNTFKYPYLLFWNKDSIYYIFTFHIEWGDGRMRNQYYPLTKEAFHANKIQGYPYPLPAESPLYNYLK